MGKNISVGFMHTRTLTKAQLIAILDSTYSSDDAEVAIVTRFGTSDRDNREDRDSKQSVIITADLNLDGYESERASAHSLLPCRDELFTGKRLSEMIAVKHLGEDIGYGNMMNWAAALWRRMLMDMNLSPTGAFAPRIIDKLNGSDELYDKWVAHLNGDEKSNNLE